MALEPPCVRLLVTDFAACFRFYRDVMPELSGCALATGAEDAGYASWDAGGVTAFALFDRGFMASALGTGDLPSPVPGRGAQDGTTLVFHLADATAVDAAVARCTAAGAALVAAAQDRPQWGPTLRTAHLRDPSGNLLELQTY